MPAARLIACHDCDLLQREVPLPAGGVATCSRCGAVLYRNSRGGRQTALALTLTAALLFAISNLYPLVSIESQGNRHATTLFGAVLTLWHEHSALIAALVFVTTLLIPALELLNMAVLLAVPRPSAALLRITLAVQPWAMVEVFMLGVLVSVAKLAHLATIVPGVALWSFGALTLLFAALTATFNPHELWRSVPVANSHAGS
ncbi:MAG: paraquat-inducible protein A [Sulfuricella sp.]|nr:paraquat-inducible protein A [Sulfuricella sp.]